MQSSAEVTLSQAVRLLYIFRVITHDFPLCNQRHRTESPYIPDFLVSTAQSLNHYNYPRHYSTALFGSLQYDLTLATHCIISIISCGVSHSVLLSERGRGEPDKKQQDAEKKDNTAASAAERSTSGDESRLMNKVRVWLDVL